MTPDGWELWEGEEEEGEGDITLVAVTINPWWGWTSTNTSFLSNNAPAHTGSAELSDILAK